MDRFIIILVLLFVLILGFIKILKTLKKYRKFLYFAYEYLDETYNFLRSKGQDHDVYTWLIENSGKFQSNMGSFGIINKLKLPSEGIIYSNYPVILNSIPRIYNCFKDSYPEFLQSVISQNAQMIEAAILRYAGNLKNKINIYEGYKKNPIRYFKEGMQTIMFFPVLTLVWFGVLSDFWFKKISKNIIFKLLTNIIAFIAFFGTILSIIVGWEKFTQIIVEWSKFGN